MKIYWDRLLGEILGLVFAVVLIKMFFAQDDSWWEIVGDMMRMNLPDVTLLKNARLASANSTSKHPPKTVD